MTKFKLQVEGDLSDLIKIGDQILAERRMYHDIKREHRAHKEARKEARKADMQNTAFQILRELIPLYLRYMDSSSGTSGFAGFTSPPPTPSCPPPPPPPSATSTGFWGDEEEEQETPSTMDPLHTDPVYGAQQTAQGPHAGTGESNPDPGYREDMNIPRGFDFASMKPDPEAWIAFSDLVKLWLQGFNCPLDEKGMPTEPQPDRLTALKSLGEGRWPLHILRYCANYGSLQRAVFQVIHERNWPWEKDLPNAMITPDEEDIALAELVAANIVQVAHAAFPDIIGFYDHSTRWKRNLKKEGERE